MSELNPNLVERTRFAFTATTLSLLFTVLAAFASYAAIQNAVPYWAVVQGPLYTSLPTAHDTLLDRALSNVGLLRLSLWPVLALVGLEIAATVSMAYMLPHRRGKASRRWGSGFVVSLVMSVIFLASIWSGFQGMTDRWNRFGAVAFGVVDDKPAQR